MRILLVTSSARGHAIAQALKRSRHNPEIISICGSRNPGIRPLASEMHVMDIMNFKKILEIAKKTKPDLAVIGPDDPIGGGLADELEAIGIPTVAPRKALARIEASKSFTRDLMTTYGLGGWSPRYHVFTEPDAFAIRAFIDACQENYVVKYDALKGGKGVKVSGDHLETADEGVAYALECIEECGRVVLEEKLIGVEFSLLAFVSGTQVVDMPAVHDHKRADVGDTGPNTGGMGTITDANHNLPFLSEKDLLQAASVNAFIAEALLKETGTPYRGILYGGFIATKNGIKVIEYNARFGDPEALNLLTLLESDFVDICLGITLGELAHDMVRFEKKATVCKYIVPKSYPNAKDERGEIVSFPSMPANAHIYFGDIAEDEDGTLRLGGSRTAGIVGVGRTLAEAEKVAEDLCKKVQGPVRHRHDIGTGELIAARSAMMKKVRS